MIINGTYTHVDFPLTSVARASLINIDGKYRKPYLSLILVGVMHTLQAESYSCHILNDESLSCCWFCSKTTSVCSVFSVNYPRSLWPWSQGTDFLPIGMKYFWKNPNIIFFGTRQRVISMVFFFKQRYFWIAAISKKSLYMLFTA